MKALLLDDLSNARTYADSVGLKLDNGEYNPNEIVVMSNDSRFTAATYNQPLTNFAVGGWSNTGIENDLMAYVGAPVQVSKRFNYKVWTNAEAFRSETDDDMRQIGAEFKEVRLGNTEVNAQTINRGLAMALDKDELAEGVITEQQAVQYLTQRVKLNQVRRAGALILAASNNQTRTWSSARDADMDIQTEITAYRDATGILPNNVIFDRAAWVLRMTAQGALTTAAGMGRAGYSPQQLRDWLQVENLNVVNAVYQSSATAKTAVNASIVFVYNRSNSPLRQDPSTIRYFWSPTDGGGPVSAFRYEVGSKKVVVGVQHNELISVVFSTGVRRITAS